MIADVQLTVRMTPQAHRALAEMAAAKGYKPSSYGQMLFDAAFAARVGRERGEPPLDAELDAQVRLVFACAGHADSAAIARAIGIPETRVIRILDGWRWVVGEKPPVDLAPPPKRAAPRKPAENGYPVETIRELWASGKTAKEIGARIGKSEGAVLMWAGQHRDICPKRRVG